MPGFTPAHAFNPGGADFALFCSRMLGHCRVSGPRCRGKQSSVLMGAAQHVGNTGQVCAPDPDLPRVMSSSPGFVLKTCLPSTVCTHHVWWDGSDLIINKWNELNVIRDELFGARDPGMLNGLPTMLVTSLQLPLGQSFASQAGSESLQRHFQGVSNTFCSEITQRQTCSPASFLR